MKRNPRTPPSGSRNLLRSRWLTSPSDLSSLVSESRRMKDDDELPFSPCTPEMRSADDREENIYCVMLIPRSKLARRHPYGRDCIFSL
ncbi:hypothetical protein EUGRSUZ_E04044 [Eucalyptus grandis]|uniref:Uncharacterized protein n=2 Tax=Eucalyptus grandis TaxID=71139 RepID=A0ACC3L0R0_EUCGR|nr:hypothetical protein EUGRSUZ_E04044 [Eucalyptus grandis]